MSDETSTDDPALDDQGRPTPPLVAGEAATLLGFLDYQRATFAWKCRGLTDDQLRVGLPPTSMTLGGMMKHLAVVEDYWFAEVVGEAQPPEPWRSVDWDNDPDWEWRTAADQSSDDLHGIWDESLQRSRAVVSDQLRGGEAQGLGRSHPAWGGQGQVSLRWVLTHMIEEYARHVGHADLIRESIDGETGE